MKAGVLFMLQKAGGFGMIAADGGVEQVFLLHSDLPPGLFDTLQQGDRLEFDTIQDSKGLRATNVTRVLHLEEEITVTVTKKKPKAAKKSPKKKKK